jgi:hypothetical protein
MNDVFVKRDRKVQPGFNMQVVMNRKATKGAIGLEIEVEGNKFPKPPGYELTHTAVKMPGRRLFWSYVHDGSLRGQDNAEYVLSKPIEFKDVPIAIEQLFNGAEGIRLCSRRQQPDEYARPPELSGVPS